LGASPVANLVEAPTSHAASLAGRPRTQGSGAASRRSNAQAGKIHA
jgi:hypothetical protein